jgi:hypothetical protein
MNTNHLKHLQSQLSPEDYHWYVNEYLKEKELKEEYPKQLRDLLIAKIKESAEKGGYKLTLTVEIPIDTNKDSFQKVIFNDFLIPKGYHFDCHLKQWTNQYTFRISWKPDFNHESDISWVDEPDDISHIKMLIYANNLGKRYKEAVSCIGESV